LEARLADSNRQIQQSRVTFVMASLAACSLLVLSVWSLLTELTTRRRAESEIQEQRETLQVLLDSIGDAVIATDRDGNITFMNPVAELMTGWPQEEACGAPLERVFRIEQAGTRAPVENPALRAIREGIIVGLANHTVLVDRSGNERHIDDSGAPIRGARGDIAGAVLVFHDVTHRRQIEEQRDRLLVEEQKARTEAESANLAKDQFIAVLSHELRTPIQPILGWVNLLSEEDLSDEARRVALETIDRNVRLQARLIEDILDLSRIATGKIQVTHGIVDPAKVVRESVQGQLPTAQAKSIALEVEIEDSRLEISGDPDRLHQVVWNLLGNAIKFTPKGGRIQVRLRRRGSSAEIEVQDDGPGIAEDFLPFVFERFRQSDSSSTRTHGGLGIGLTIARQIVELHGGIIQAESDGEGHGSIFRVLLPIRPFRGETPLPAAAPPETQNGGGTSMPSLPLPLSGLDIIVLEDEPDSLRLVLTVLRRNGATARGCSSAEEGRDALDEAVPDIVVSDIGMPVEDGYQFIETVRQRSPERGGLVPAIALTAFTGIEDQKRALEVGFDRHLAKPIEPWDLVEAIVEVVGKKGE
jgi:PAS domain S-box-containing protein